MMPENLPIPEKSIQQIDSIIWPPTINEREKALKYYNDLSKDKLDEKEVSKKRVIVKN